MHIRTFFASLPIRKKLLILLLFAFLPVAGIIAASGLHFRNHVINNAKNNALLLVQSLATQQEEIDAGIEMMLSTLAQLPEVQKLDAEACNKLFRKLNKRYPYYSIIAAATPDGNMFAASSPFQPGTVNLADRKHIKDAIRTGEFSTGEYIVDKVSKTQSINYTCPVFDAHKNLIAIVIAGFKLDEYIRYITNANLSEGTAVVITDYAGVRLFRLPESDSFALGTPIDENSFKRVSGDLDHGLFESVGNDGINRIYAFRQLRLKESSPPYLYMLVDIPKGKILHQADLTMVFNLLILGIIALIVMSLAWVLGEFIVIKPINRLVVATRKLGNGELSIRTSQPHTSDELGNLAKSFDDMALMLERRNIERKQAEEALRESQERYHSLYDSSLDAILLTVPDGSILAVNSSGCRMFEQTEEEIKQIGRNGVVDTSDPRLALALEERNQTGKFTGELTFIRKSGARFPGEISTSVFNDKDGNIRTSMIIRDITERNRAEELLKESEARYRQLYENAPAGIYEIDLTTGRMLSVNDSMCEYTGYAKDELLTMNALDILTEESQKIFKERMAGYAAGKPVTENIEFKARSKSGREFWMSVNPKYFYKEGIPVRASVVAHDITERKRLEAEKAQFEIQNRQLQKATSLGLMAGAIAHNFNNQLQVVIGNLEMAMNDKPSDSEFLTEAMNAARKAADVSGLMLTYLGQKSGKQEPIDLSEVCRRRFTLLQSVAPKDMILKADFPLSGPVIRANADQILHVLTNLVTNAWESSEENRRSIDLTVKTVSQKEIPAFKRFPAGWNPQESVYACLEVADSGSGMACKDIENIFDPFYTTKFTGRGMGLSVVLGIVKAHNGGITVESKPGQGSVFRVYLPPIFAHTHVDNTTKSVIRRINPGIENQQGTNT